MDYEDFDIDSISFDDDAEARDTEPSPVYYGQRGLMGDIGSRLGRGVLEVGSLTGSALDTLGVDTPINEIVDDIEQSSTFLAPDVDEYLGEEGFVERGIKGGIQSLVPSLSAAVPGAVVGGAVGGVPGAVVGGLLGTLGLFGLGTYGEAKKDYLELHPEDLDGAKEYAWKQGLIEGGVETAATGIELATAGLGKVATRPLVSTIKQFIKTPVKDIAKAAGKTMGVEVLTEMGQSYYGTEFSKEAGLTEMSGGEAALESIIPAMTMSLFFVGGAQGYNAVQRKKLADALNSGDPELQGKAANVIREGILASDNKSEDAKEVAKSWDILSKTVINDPDGTFDIDTAIVEQVNDKLLQAAKPVYAKPDVVKGLAAGTTGPGMAQLPTKGTAVTGPVMAEDLSVREAAKTTGPAMAEELTADTLIRDYEQRIEVPVTRFDKTKAMQEFEEAYGTEETQVPGEPRIEEPVAETEREETERAEDQKLKDIVAGKMDEEILQREGMTEADLEVIKDAATKQLMGEEVSLLPEGEETTGYDDLDRLFFEDASSTEEYIDQFPNKRAVIEDIQAQVEEYAEGKPDWLKQEMEEKLEAASQKARTERKEAEKYDYPWTTDPETKTIATTTHPETGRTFVTKGEKGVGFKLYEKTEEGLVESGPDTYQSMGAAKKALDTFVPYQQAEQKVEDYTVQKGDGKSIINGRPTGKATWYIFDKDGKPVGTSGYKHKHLANTAALQLEGKEVTERVAPEKYTPVVPQPEETVESPINDTVTALAASVKQLQESVDKIPEMVEGVIVQKLPDFEEGMTSGAYKKQVGVAEETEGDLEITAPEEEGEVADVEELDFDEQTYIDEYDDEYYSANFGETVEGTDPKQARSLLNKFFGKKVIDKWIASDKLQLHDIGDRTDIPEKVRGRYLTSQDTVELYLDRMNPQDVIRVALHEMSHAANIKGSLFGDKTDKFLADFAAKKSINEDINTAYNTALRASQLAEEAGKGPYTEKQINHETLAYFLQNADLSKTVNKRWYNKVISYLRRMTAKWFGPKAARQMSPDEIVDVYVTAIKAGGISAQRDIDVAPSGPAQYESVQVKPESYKKVVAAAAKRKPIATQLGSQAKQLAKDFVQVISEGLNNISPELGSKLSRFEFNLNQVNKKHSDAVAPLLSKLKGMDTGDKAQLHYALINGDTTKRNQILGKYKAGDAWNKAQGVLSDIEGRAGDVGLLDRKITNYFPRRIKDLTGFAQHRKENPTDDKVTAEIELARQAAKRKGQLFTEADEQQIVANIMASGQYKMLHRPGSTKDRTVSFVKPEYMQYYEGLEDTLKNHIFEMNDNIEKRKFLGKYNQRPALMRQLNSKARTIERLQENTDRTPEVQEEIDSLTNEWEALATQAENIEKEMGDSISALVADKDIQNKDEAIDLIRARMNEKGPGKVIGAARDIGYLFSIGQVTSAITQLGDIAWNLYSNPREAVSGIGSAIKNIASGKGVSQEDFDFGHALKEFGDAPTSKLLDWSLKWSGLKHMDLLGKESLFQSTKKRIENQSLDQFSKEFGQLFDNNEEKIKEVHDSFQKGEKTEDTLFTLYNQLSKYQPINLSQVPKKYLTSGNGRVFYMLKTFNIKALNNMYREASTEFKNGNYAKGAKNLAALTSLLALAGAGADEIKDFLSGREGDFGDNVHDNLIKLTMASRYSLEKGLDSDRLVSSVIQGQLPPVRFADDLITDLYSLASDKKDFKFKTLGEVPLLGRVAYSRGASGQTSYLKGKRTDIYDEVREGASFGDVRRKVARFNKKARKYGEAVITPATLKKIKKEAIRGK